VKAKQSFKQISLVLFPFYYPSYALLKVWMKKSKLKMINAESKKFEKSENQLFSEKWIVKTNKIMVKEQVILFLSL